MEKTELSQPFFFVRHGQTEPNARGLRCGGDLDVPLTDAGCAQAWDVAWRMKQALPTPGVVLCGDLVRVRQTAMIFAAVLGGLQIVNHDILNERRLGEWNQRPIEETEEALKQGQTPPGGESEVDFTQRMGGAATWISSHLSQMPLVVSSKGVARVLNTVLGGTGRLLVANAEVVEFRFFPEASGGPRWDVRRDLTSGLGAQIAQA
jgi:2,3-bisphosphoglycerate-dependent phosphoglycerate mutase